MVFNDKWAVLAGYFTLSVMLMSVALLAIYRILRCSTRLRLCFQTERGRKHALSGNEQSQLYCVKCKYNELIIIALLNHFMYLYIGGIFAGLFLLRVTSKIMTPFWASTLSVIYGFLIVMATTGLFRDALRDKVLLIRTIIR